MNAAMVFNRTCAMETKQSVCNDPSWFAACSCLLYGRNAAHCELPMAGRRPQASANATGLSLALATANRRRLASLSR